MALQAYCFGNAWTPRWQTGSRDEASCLQTQVRHTILTMSYYPARDFLENSVKPWRGVAKRCEALVRAREKPLRVNFWF